MKKFWFAFIFCVPTISLAGYHVVGPIEAEDCFDFGAVVSCSTKKVTEVRRDGKRFEVAAYFEKVSEYDSGKQICFINTKSRGLGPISAGINFFNQPEFWGYDKDGKFGKVDADYIRFKCIKK